MAKVGKSNKLLNYLIISILLIGVIATIIAAKQSTENRQKASEIDLNSAESIQSTNNVDGTMGPQSSSGNYSNLLATEKTGQLKFQVSATEATTGEAQNPTEEITPTTNITPTPTLSPTPTPLVKKGQANKNNQNIPKKEQALIIKSISVTITKLEVHLVKTGAATNETEDTETNEAIQGADKWETLTLETPLTINLSDLSQSSTIENLGLTSLAEGKYSELRLYISEAKVIFDDETEKALSIPGKANTVRVVRPFEIMAGKTTVIEMMFNPKKSVVLAGPNAFLKPVVAKFQVKVENN